MSLRGKITGLASRVTDPVKALAVRVSDPVKAVIPKTLAGRLAVGIPATAALGAGAYGVAPYFTGSTDNELLYSIPEGQGLDQNLAQRMFNAREEGMQSMSNQKFGGVKLAGQKQAGFLSGGAKLLSGLGGMFSSNLGRTLKRTSDLPTGTVMDDATQLLMRGTQPVGRRLPTGKIYGMDQVHDLGGQMNIGGSPGAPNWQVKDPTMLPMGSMSNSIIEDVQNMSPLKQMGMVAAPLAAGGLALEAIDPLSEVLSPVAKDMGMHLSHELGYGELPDTPFEETMQRGMNAFAEQTAKEIASGMASGVGTGARMGVDLFRPGTPLETMIGNDAILSRANKQQKALLAQSYEAMQRVAPTLSKEPFVAKNFLRDVLITNNGPDHATLSSLAKSEHTISQARMGPVRPAGTMLSNF